MRILLTVLLIASVAPLAGAAIVDHNAPDGIAARIIDGGSNAVYVTTDGRAFVIDYSVPGEWEEITPAWPVPFEDIAEVSLYFAVGSDGSAWGHSYPWTSTMDWNLLPPLPITPVPGGQESLGSVKSLFR